MIDQTMVKRKYTISYVYDAVSVTTYYELIVTKAPGKPAACVGTRPLHPGPSWASA